MKAAAKKGRMCRPRAPRPLFRDPPLSELVPCFALCKNQDAHALIFLCLLCPPPSPAAALAPFPLLPPRPQCCPHSPIQTHPIILVVDAASRLGQDHKLKGLEQTGRGGTGKT